MMKRRNLWAAAGGAALTSGAAALARQPRLFELRIYRLTPQRADDLVAMFEAHFLDAYQAAGAAILATFRDRDDPNRWVWIRAFADEAQRDAALKGFYGSDVWLRRRAEANATIQDASDALLLQEHAGALASLAAPGPGARLSNAVIECTRYLPKTAQDGESLNALLADMAALTARQGGVRVAHLTNAARARTNARRPVRTEPAIVTLTRFADLKAYDACAQALRNTPDWANLDAACRAQVAAPIERYRLQPTARSALR
jgi:hypothetical protein